jgi:HK97 family phage prohead protease
MNDFFRSYPLLDVNIRSGGDGRTVEMYAAVWNTPTEIRDNQGHYMEQIAPTAFNRTVSQKGTKFGVFFNHGRTLMGTPSDRYTMPLGLPIEPPRVDERGLLTVTRYSETELGDEVLQLIKDGAITGQSFSGRFLASDPMPGRGGMYKPARDGSLMLVTRSEVAMIEYGPTPFPAYDVPMLVGTRSGRADLPETQAAQLLGYFAAIDSIVDQAQETISILLGTPNLDDIEEMDPEEAGEPAMTPDQQAAEEAAEMTTPTGSTVAVASENMSPTASTSPIDPATNLPPVTAPPRSTSGALPVSDSAQTTPNGNTPSHRSSRLRAREIGAIHHVA